MGIWGVHERRNIGQEQPSGLDMVLGKTKHSSAGSPNSWWKHTSAYRYFRKFFSGQHWILSPKLVLWTLLYEITVSPACFQVVWRSLGGRYRCTNGFQGWGIAEYTLRVKISSLSISHKNMGFVVAWAGWVGKQYKVPPGLQGRRASFQSPPTTWEEVQMSVSAVSAALSRKSHQRQHLPVPASPGWLLCLSLKSQFVLNSFVGGAVLLWQGPWKLGNLNSNPSSVTRGSYLASLSWLFSPVKQNKICFAVVNRKYVD